MKYLTRHIKCFLRYVGTIIFVSLLVSCQIDADRRISKALAVAGNNRGELEAVLEHYADDAEKLAAAKFLIENMSEHYSFVDSELMVRYHQRADSFITANPDISIFDLCDSIDAIADEMDVLTAPMESDCRLITSEYLIDNIDMAFEQWRGNPWLRHLDFDQFCEYVLPYKVKDLQPLDDWRSKFSDVYADELEPLDYCDLFAESPYRACKLLNEAYKRDFHPGPTNEKWVRVYDVATRMKVPHGMCSDFVYLTAVIFRSVGLPVARDCTPHWGNQRLGHSWNAVLAQTGKTVPFVGMISTLEEGRIVDERLPKVFRAGYAANPDLKRLNAAGEYVPPFFRNIFQHDVTEEYVAVSDIEIDCDVAGHQTAWLCVYGDNGWTAVDYGGISGGKAHFGSAGRNIVYLPVVYSESGSMTALSDPFILGFDGSVRFLSATETTVSASLDRKYPVLKYVWDYAKLVKGGQFEASDDPEFKHGVRQIHTIGSGRAVSGDVLVGDTVAPYRYWRYINRLPETYGSMAEIVFYESGSDRPIKGRIIGTEGSWEDNPVWRRENLFDGDVLTSYCAPSGVGCWVGMDFGKSVKIGRIGYTPRGDGNMVEPGDCYELLYWADGRWNSLGRKNAEGVSVSYDNIPAGALLLLRDITKGNDERIFLMDDEGRQEWW